MAKNKEFRQAVSTKFPAWQILPDQPISYIYADHRVETDIDVNGVGRVRVKPGYNVNVEDIRYGA